MSSSSTQALRFDFGVATSSSNDSNNDKSESSSSSSRFLTGLPNPMSALQLIQNQYLLPFQQIISPTPTRYILVVKTAGDALKAIKDTANGRPYGKPEPQPDGSAAPTFELQNIEFLSIRQSKKDDNVPFVVHVADEETGKKFLDALPFSYVAAAFAKENASLIMAGDWNEYAMKVQGGIRFAANPPLAAKLYDKNRDPKPFNQDLSWVARPSTTDTWLNHGEEI